MKSDLRLKRAASVAVRAMTESLESRVLFAEVAGTLLVDVNATTLTQGTPAEDIPNAGTLGGVFESTGGDATPVIDRPAVGATSGTVGIRLDGGDFLRLLGSAGGGVTTAPAGITGAGDVSIEAWVWNPGVANEETIVAWGKRGGPDGTNMSFNYGSSLDYGAVGHWGSPDLGWAPTAAGVPASRLWHHLVYTYDGTTDRVYVDGVQTNSEAVALNVSPDTPILIGSQLEADGSTPTGALRGTMTIGRLRIHDGVLTPAQIATNYNAEKAQFIEPVTPTPTPTPVVKLVDVNPTALPAGAADNLANAGTLGGFFKATGGGDTVPVIALPDDAATGGTYGIRLDGTDYLQSVDAQGALLPAPASITGLDAKTSIEVWAWNPSLATEETVLSWGKRGGPDGTNMSFNYGANPDYGAIGHWGSPDLGWGATPPVEQHWHHLVYTFDGQTQRVYSDGVQLNSEDLGPGVLNIFAGPPINIGTQIEADGTTPTPPLRGSMTLGRVRIYSGALTPEVIAADYNAEKASYIEPVLPPPPLPEKLVDVDATALPAGVANDIVNAGTLGGVFEALGGPDSTPVIGLPLTSSTTGTKGIRLDGNDYLQLLTGPGGSILPAPASITGVDPKQSVDAWVYNPGIAPEEAFVSWGHRGGAPDGSNASFNYGSNAAWGAEGRWGAPDIGWGPTVPPAGTWHHLAYTYNGSTSRVYVDGALVNTEALGNGAVNTFAGTAITLGAQLEADGTTVTVPLRGSLTVGKLRIYAGVLTNQQITDTFNAEKATFVAPNVPTPTALTAGPTHRYSFSNATGGAAAGAVVKDLVGTADATVRGAGATFSGNRAVLPGGASATAAYIDLPNGLVSSNGVAKGGTGAVTFEGWVRQTGQQAWSRIYDFGTGNTGEITDVGGTASGLDFFMLTAQTGADPVHRFEATDAGNAGNRYDDVTHPFDNQDLHFAVTWSEITHEVRYYENGKQVGAFPSSVLLSDIDDVNDWLGRSQFTGDANFQGEYDEFRIYNRALTSGEVLADFQSGADVLTNTPPVLSSTQVNDGSAQRSQVTTLSLKFDRPVVLAAGAASLQLLNSGGSGANNNSAPTDATSALAGPTTPDGGKTWVFTINPASPFAEKTTAGTATGSLVDGIYKLNVDPTKVAGFGIPMAGTTPVSFTFHRLFGDNEGNKTVNNLDFANFRLSFSKSTGQAGFNAAFDFDNNGTVNNADFGLFRNRFGKVFTY